MSIPTVVFLNNKGGVGKTTCASLYAEYLALRLGKRVLIIDWDGQMNLTADWVGTDFDDDKNIIPIKHPDIDETDPEDLELYNIRSSIVDIFKGKEVLPHSTYIGPEDPEDFISARVDIISGDREGMKQVLDKSERKHSSQEDEDKDDITNVSSSQIVSRLSEFCSSPELGNYYDQIIVDAGPSETPLFRAAIQASTHIVSPYKPESYSIMGVTTLVNNVMAANANRIGRDERIEFIGMLPCIVDRGRGGSHEETIKECMDAISQHVPAPLMLINSKKISSRQLKHDIKPDSIFKLRPSDPIRRECEAVFGYINEKVSKNG